MQDFSTLHFVGWREEVGLPLTALHDQPRTKHVAPRSGSRNWIQLETVGEIGSGPECLAVSCWWPDWATKALIGREGHGMHLAYLIPPTYPAHEPTLWYIIYDPSLVILSYFTGSHIFRPAHPSGSTRMWWQIPLLKRSFVKQQKL